MAIYQVDGGFVCSAYHCWLPGVYESPIAGRLAYRVTPAGLAALWEAKFLEHGTPLPDSVCFTADELRSAIRAEKGPPHF